MDDTTLARLLRERAAAEPREGDAWCLRILAMTEAADALEGKPLGMTLGHRGLMAKLAEREACAATADAAVGILDTRTAEAIAARIRSR